MDTSQGCPLSPFLFSLVIVALAVALRSSPEVGALEIGSIRECLVLYGGDMLFLKIQVNPFVRFSVSWISLRSSGASE